MVMLLCFKTENKNDMAGRQNGCMSVINNFKMFDVSYYVSHIKQKHNIKQVKSQ